jgi:hypothetical protein
MEPGGGMDFSSPVVHPGMEDSVGERIRRDLDPDGEAGGAWGLDVCDQGRVGCGMGWPTRFHSEIQGSDFGFAEFCGDIEQHPVFFAGNDLYVGGKSGRHVSDVVGIRPVEEVPNGGSWSESQGFLEGP